jgi:serine/threonine-protein kinase
MMTAARDAFFDSLRQLPLLQPAERAELSTLIENFPTAHELAQELMRREWLTAYQASRLLEGHGEDLLFGNYLLLNKIGEGGMGRVYKARQRNVDRIVALKVLRRECLTNAKIVKRFQREIKILGSLKASPHLVRAFDSDIWDGQHFIEMEYIDGVDLARRVKRNGPLPIAEALDFARQTALGLQDAHEGGLVHRDIKPANLLVTKGGSGSGLMPRPGTAAAARYPNGLVKILDLGLARSTEPNEGNGNLTVTGSLMGTPDFLAPEQARDPSACDIRADLYSLGCTLYYLIAGRIPFPRGGIPEKVLQHASHDADPLVVVRRQRMEFDAHKSGTRPSPESLAVSPEVETIVRRLMAKRPEDRFPTPLAAAEALERVARRVSEEALTVTPVADRTVPIVSPTEWQALVAGTSGPQPIIHIERPRRRRGELVRWATILVVTSLLVSGFVFVQNNVSKPQAAASQGEMPKRTSK